MITYFIYTYLILNLATLVCFGLDKWFAVKKQWRIPESTLLLLALLGGSIGALVAMQFFHHKTKKKRFSIGIPIMLIVQFAILGYALYYWFLAI